MNRKLLIIFILAVFSVILHAQRGYVSGNSNVYPDSVQYSIHKTKTNFIGIHFCTSIEFVPIKNNSFKELITNEDIPIADLSPFFQTAWLSFMRNWMFSSISFSLASIEPYKTNDLLISSVSQFNFTAEFGYNVIKKQNIIKEQSMVISPYIGFRYARFRHVTSLLDENISFDEYFETRELDLRISEYSGVIGISSIFTIEDMWNCGFYCSYLFDLHNHPIVSTNQNTITNEIRNPLGSIVIGLGIGVGFDAFVR